jgi:predicted phosphoserine aminotransferase
MDPDIPFGRFFLPGPTEVRPEVLRAMVRPVIGHRGPEMRALLSGMDADLRALFGTTRPVHLSTSSATGLMEAAVTGLSGRRILCLDSGAFGARFRRIADRSGRPADSLEVEWGHAVEVDAVAEALDREPGRWDLVTVVHSETSTGVLNPVEEIARAVHEREDVLLAVDGVTSVGGVRVDAEARGLDYVLTGSQKAIALPPGLALATASERALARAESVPARSFYFDVLAFERRALEHETTNTPAVPLLYALEAQLRRIRAEGLEARWERHERMARRTAEWVEETAADTGAPLRVLAPAGRRSPTVTAILLPDGLRGPAIARATGERGWTIAPGYGRLKERTIRIGHMGDHTPEELDSLLDVLGETLREALDAGSRSRG